MPRFVLLLASVLVLTSLIASQPTGIVPIRNLDMNWNWKYLTRDYVELGLHAEGMRTGLGFDPMVLFPPSRLDATSQNSEWSQNFSDGSFTFDVPTGTTHITFGDGRNQDIAGALNAALLEAWLSSMSNKPRPTAHDDAVDLQAMVGYTLRGEQPPIPDRGNATLMQSLGMTSMSRLSDSILYAVCVVPVLLIFGIYWCASRY